MADVIVAPVASRQVGVAPANFLDGHALADDYYIPNDGCTIVRFRNGGVGAVTVTIETPRTYAGLALADQTVAVAGGSTAYFGPFDPGIFNDDDGRLHITLSGGTFAQFVAEAVRI